MNGRVEHLTSWVYSGVWGVLTRWFRVPDSPPSLPVSPGETVDSFRPATGFLRLLKVKFWIVLALIDGAIFITWLVITVAVPPVGIILFPFALAVAVLPDMIAYIAIHLRYDTTWYVMSERSLRIRRGIWVIHETTITFENVQNVAVRQGPVQRLFGIADVAVETAGGGGGQAQEAHGGQTTAAHRGLIEGVADAQRIRNLVLSRLRHSRSAGLGDEANDPVQPVTAFGSEHLSTLREIRDAVRTLVATTGG
jgi:membrane protein YdbS with pleckstrin-like domain